MKNVLLKMAQTIDITGLRAVFYRYKQKNRKTKYVNRMLKPLKNVLLMATNLG